MKDNETNRWRHPTQLRRGLYSQTARHQYFIGAGSADSKRKILITTSIFYSFKPCVVKQKNYRKLHSMSSPPDGIRRTAEVKDGIGRRAEVKDGIGWAAEVKDGIGRRAEVKDGIGWAAEVKDGIRRRAEDGIRRRAEVEDGIRRRAEAEAVHVTHIAVENSSRF